MLTRETEQELRNGIPLHVLPATLRDALLVTHGLGISFMWVDCLCIEQDNKLDWGREALNMQQVYRNATITLRAACTDSVTQSLFPRRPSRTQYCALEWRDDEASKQTIYLRPGLAFSTMTTEKATISNRGWTLEEDLLAPRTLTFGKQQVWFDCAKGRFDEAGRHTAPAEDYSNKANLQALYSEQGIHKWAARLARTIGLPPVISINLPYWAANAMRIAQQQQFWFQGTFHFAGGSTFTYFDLWRQIIDQFSARKLTHSRDVFLALAGVARAFQQTHGDEYIAGMWRSDLVRSLTWNRLAAHRRKRDHSILIDLPSPPIRYMAPSWSWASITGRKVNFLGSLGSDGGTFTPIAKVQAVHLMPQSGSVFGPLMEDSSITLYAPVIGIPDPREPVKDGPLQLVREYIQLLLQTEANTGHEFSQQHEGHEGQEFTLMHLGNYEDWRHWHFYTALLLLESCASSTACKRIGRFVFTMPGRDPVFTDIREDTLRCKEFLDTKMKSRTIRIV
ncbi:hypothetical protein K461DRAFT_319110 [Myriangium duriaei CBS 260.36]|uniref:Heterokaryon incompatibility domain-containing protein n=1 Tax=Myriangium duriaei CBS 260.36 TaxID=1168546 RepID=A0A9P4J337_9PEZI|nr:hypothetical protein K461DRAFT_319110 [Myriangium duriaei CBS 260.36]